MNIENHHFSRTWWLKAQFFRTGPPVNAFLNSETVRKLQDVPQLIGVEREGL